MGEDVARARLAASSPTTTSAPGLQPYLDELGFNTVGYGCTTCIGNSGPLPEEVSAAIADGDLVACAVLSGNRNFEARIHPEVKANYLASPPLVVAYALAGRMDIDLASEPLGQTPDGERCYLRDLWPTAARDPARRSPASVAARCSRAPTPTSSPATRPGAASPVPEGELYAWDAASTYVRRPPYFDGHAARARRGRATSRARAASSSLGDSVTTDHISPAGAIRPDSPAGSYLVGARRRAARISTRTARGAATTR